MLQQSHVRKAVQPQSNGYAGVSDAILQQEGAEGEAADLWYQTCNLYINLYAIALQQEDALML